jgi:hypothetical protein
MSDQNAQSFAARLRSNVDAWYAGEIGWATFSSANRAIWDEVPRALSGQVAQLVCPLAPTQAATAPARSRSVAPTANSREMSASQATDRESSPTGADPFCAGARSARRASPRRARR